MRFMIDYNNIDFYSEDKRNFDYNCKEIERRLEKLCSIAKGMDISILPYINDSCGKFSKKKAIGFINDIIRINGYKGKEAQFYQAFFYCTIRCHANQSIFDGLYYGPWYTSFRACSTFQDILNKARLVEADSKKTHLQSMEDLMYQDFYDMEDFGYGENDGFFILMDRLYEWLTDETYESIDKEGFEHFFHETTKYADAVKNRYERLSADELDEEYAKSFGYDSYAQYMEALKQQAKDEGFDNLDDYYYFLATDGMTDEQKKKFDEEEARFWEEEREWQEMSDRNRPAWEQYKAEFEDVDKFVEMYRKYRKLYFKVDHDDFYNRIESMIYNYMYIHRLSVSVSDEAVIDELAVLDDITSQLKKVMKRSKGRNGL